MIAVLRRWRHTRDLADDARVLDGLGDGGRWFFYPLGRKVGLRPNRLHEALSRLQQHVLRQQPLVRYGMDDLPTGPRRWYALTEAGHRHLAARRDELPSWWGADPLFDIDYRRHT